jgi:hypothetical protein
MRRANGLNDNLVAAVGGLLYCLFCRKHRQILLHLSRYLLVPQNTCPAPQALPLLSPTKKMGSPFFVPVVFAKGGIPKARSNQPPHSANQVSEKFQNLEADILVLGMDAVILSLRDLFLLVRSVSAGLISLVRKEGRWPE